MNFHSEIFLMDLICFKLQINFLKLNLALNLNFKLEKLSIKVLTSLFIGCWGFFAEEFKKVFLELVLRASFETLLHGPEGFWTPREVKNGNHLFLNIPNS